MSLKIICITMVTSLLIWMSGCIEPGKKPIEEEKKRFPEVQNLSVFPQTVFIPSLEHPMDVSRNNVYCVTLLYAWDGIRQQLGSPLQIPEQYPDLDLLHRSRSFRDVLKENEYTVSAEVEDDNILVRAEFSKSLPFPAKLTPYADRLVFDGEPVASFGAPGYPGEHYKVIRILYYKNSRNFIVKLLPEDPQHEIILFATDQPEGTLADMTAEVKRLIAMGKEQRTEKRHEWKYQWNYGDSLLVPKMAFNLETNYRNLEGNDFFSGGRPFRILRAWQRTAFVIDESGAEIESEAEMEESVEEIEEEEFELPVPKKMFFDQPFLLLMQRKNAPNPYFVMWVANTELMIRE
jgi:hypothetical protein